MTSERYPVREPFTKKNCPSTGEYCRILSRLAIRSSSTSPKHEIIMQGIDQISLALRNCDTQFDICGVEHDKTHIQQYFYPWR